MTRFDIAVALITGGALGFLINLLLPGNSMPAIPKTDAERQRERLERK